MRTSSFLFTAYILQMSQKVSPKGRVTVLPRLYNDFKSNLADRT